MKKAMLVMRFFQDGRGKNLENKFSSQIRAVEKLGYSCTYFTIDKGVLYRNESGERKPIKRIPFYNTPILHNIFEYMRLFRCAANEVQNGYDFVYCRSAAMTHWFPKAIKTFAKSSSNVVVEIPTYPPEKEVKSDKRLWRKIVNSYSRGFSNYASRFVDLYALMGDKADSYLGKPAINIINGTDVSQFPKYCRINKDDTIDMVGVASIVDYHGFDRVIEGINEYKKNGGIKDIVFHIVGSDGGDGTLSRLKHIVNEEQLCKNVVFEGPLYGSALDELYNKCDLACQSLAGHRKDMKIQFDLKTAEYISRGIPFIACSTIKEVVDGIPGCYDKIPDNDVPVNIADIMSFISSTNYKTISDDMRAFASKFSWCEQFNNILMDLKRTQ